MINEQIKKIVKNALGISDAEYSEELAAGDIAAWDSLAHLRLLQAIEAEFSIILDVSDAIEIESVEDLITIVNEYTKTREVDAKTCA